MYFVDFHSYQTESKFLRFASGALIRITGHLIGVQKNVNLVGTLSFRRGKKISVFKKLLELVSTTVCVFHRSLK